MNCTKFGRLTIVEVAYIKNYKTHTKIYYKCKCDCGNFKDIRSDHLKGGKTTSCGCFSLEMHSLIATTHGRSKQRVYKIWVGIGARGKVSYTERSAYKDVTRCKRWDSFENFYEDMGEPPSSNHTLDRINPFGNYEPSNCRWATPKEQALNRRDNSDLWKFYSSKDRPISFSLFRTRLRNGWSTEKAVSHEKMKNQFG